MIIDGDVDALKFVAYYVKGDAVVAVASMQRDPVVSKASELLRLGLMPSPEELRAGKVRCRFRGYVWVVLIFCVLQDLLTVDIASVASKPKVV